MRYDARLIAEWRLAADRLITDLSLKDARDFLIFSALLHDTAHRRLDAYQSSFDKAAAFLIDQLSETDAAAGDLIALGKTNGIYRKSLLAVAKYLGVVKRRWKTKVFWDLP